MQLMEDATGKHSILVIDDDPEIRECISFALQEDGINAEYAADMDSGIVAARSKRPSVILLDYLMTCPVKPAEVARLRVAAGDPLVILMTASRDHEIFRQLGVDQLLLKPFNVDNLLKAVSRGICAVVGDPDPLPEHTTNH